MVYFGQKSEDKVKKLSGDLRRLQNASVQAKNFNDALKTENENLKKNLKTCTKVDENHNFLVDINCSFENRENYYSCYAQHLKIDKENSTIDSTNGDHVLGKNNNDVTALVVFKQSTKYLPNGISYTFPNLKKLVIENSNLKKIDQLGLEKLDKLTNLAIRGNKIEIRSNSFEELPQLIDLDLSKNKIQKLPSKVFEKLGNLKNLDLSDNEITTLAFDVIPAKNNIENFNMQQNRLAKIDPRIFKRLFNVETINFINNRCIDGKANEHQDKIKLFGEIATSCSADDENGFCGIKYKKNPCCIVNEQLRGQLNF